MPTGYTADIAEGKDVSFEQFVWRCSRGVMATITMRDEPLDKLPPECFEPSTQYHEQQISAARAELLRLEALTADQAATEATTHHAIEVARAKESNACTEARRRRYQEMISRVRAWTPPTPDHQGLKDFMLRQLDESEHFDCYQLPEPKPPKDWRAMWIEKLRSDIAYHETQIREEIERTEGRNKWLAELRASVPMPESMP